MTRRLLSRAVPPLRVCLFVLFFVCAATWPAFAGTVSGTVRNGTSGKVAAGVEMILIQLQGGMQPVATTKTDADGHYSFDNPTLGTGPMLIRAVYRGVNYHEPATPGRATVDMQVFEPTDKAGAFAVTARAIIVQPNGADLVIGEEYNIENKTQPPLAYYRADGSFLFTIPDGAQLSDVSALGSSGMAVVQTTIDKGKDEKAIAFPFRPGESGVRLSYKLPYPGNQASLMFVSPYAVNRLAIFAPPTVQITGGGFAPAGQEQGFNVYMRESVAAKTPILVSISGTAPPPSQGGSAPGAGDTGAGATAGDDSQNPAVNSRADTGTPQAPVASVTTLPARLDGLKWILVAGFAAMFTLGIIFLWRQSPAVVASAPAGFGQDAPAAAIAPAASRAAAPPPATTTNLDKEVRGSLDELKDSLFRLELRREAGTLSEQDYARERERVQSVLRDLVKG